MTNCEDIDKLNPVAQQRRSIAVLADKFVMIKIIYMPVRRFSFTMKLKLSSGGEGDFLERKYTCDGEDVSPQLSWSEIPKGTVSLILVMDDPDAPVGTFTHWILYNLDPETKSLSENMQKTAETSDGFAQGMNDFGRVGYNGPCPPGKSTHRYFFSLYATSQEPHLESKMKKKQIMKVVNQTTIDKVTTMRRYSRS